MKLPRISIKANPTTLIEDEGTITKITLSSNRKISKAGLDVTIDSGEFRSLGDFEINPSQLGKLVKGGEILSGNDELSGFTVRMTNKTTTISLPVFNDNDAAPGDPDFNVNSDIGKEVVTYRIIPSKGDYTINNKRSKIKLTFFDTKSNLLAVTNGLDDNLGDIEESRIIASSAEENAIQSVSKQDVISSLEGSGLISIETQQTTGSSSLAQQISSFETGLDAEALTIADASALSESKFFTVEDI